MGAKSVREAVHKLDRLTGRQAAEAIEQARDRLHFRETARDRDREMREEWKRSLARLKDCRKRLPIAIRDYWQAVRDYTAEYTYWRAFIDSRYRGDRAREARRNALANLDKAIAKQGLQVAGGRVEIVVVQACDEQMTAVTAGP